MTTSAKKTAASAAKDNLNSNIESMVQNGQKVLDQMVENNSISYEKAIASSKEQLEKVMSSLDEMKTVQEASLEALAATGTATVKAFETLSSQLMSYTKKAMEDNIAATKAAMNAKSLQEAMNLQRNFTQSSIDGFVSEANKLTEMLPQLAKDSVEPISSQAKATYEKLIKSAA